MHAATLHAADTYPGAVSRHQPDEPAQGPTIHGREIKVGDTFDVEVGAVAHGGHMVARVGDVVAFTRHALPGERVRIRVTDVRSKFVRADAVEVLRAHSERRAPLCRVAGSCGGCDFQHATQRLQRELKLDVMREALLRQGRLPPDRVDHLLAEGVIDLGMDTGWRSRMRYRVAESNDGRPTLAMFRHRSGELVDASSCVIAEPRGHAMAIALASELAVGHQVYAATGVDGPIVSAEGADSIDVRQRVNIDGVGVDFTTPIDGFWQVHPLLVQAVIDRLLEVSSPSLGETWWDLYAGAGPLAAALGARVGSNGHVEAVESSSLAVASGKRALVSMPWVRWHRSDVRRWLEGSRERGGRRSGSTRSTPHGVVLDPPRAGAGAGVLRSICARRPRSIVIVACDPVALGRDTAIAGELGYEMVDLRVWDAFPQTHHMEAMASFQPRHQIS